MFRCVSGGHSTNSAQDKSGDGKITDFADIKTGAYNRQPSAFRSSISAEPGAEFPAEKGRYHLYVSYACPWAHRTLIVRKLKGLEDFVSFTVVHWHMGEKGWRFITPEESLPGPNTTPDPIHPTFTHLREIYLEQNPSYAGRFLVPTLYDIKTRRIVSNESSEIIRMFYTAFDALLPPASAAVDLYPAPLRAAIDDTNAWTYHDINNGVYKAGFATSASAYEEAVTTLFKSLDRAEAHLASQHHAQGGKGGGPFYFGAQLTEADVRLYTTIVRFDAVYVQHFKCNLRDIRSGYPALHRWLRALYWDLPAFRDTTCFDHIKKHYTRSHGQINPHAITPLGPVPDILPKDEEVPAVKAALERA